MKLTTLEELEFEKKLCTNTCYDVQISWEQKQGQKETRKNR